MPSTVLWRKFILFLRIKLLIFSSIKFKHALKWITYRQIWVNPIVFENLQEHFFDKKNNIK